MAKISGKPRPLPPPPKKKKTKDGKEARFALRAASSLIWGNRGLLDHFILEKINGKPRFPPPLLSPKIKDGKMAGFCPSRGFDNEMGNFEKTVFFEMSCTTPKVELMR